MKFLKNQIRKLVLVSLTVLLYSCDSNTNKDFKKLNLNIQPKKIVGETLDFKEFITPTTVLYKEPYLFLEDSKAKNYLHAVNLKSNTYINNFGKKGKGPGEMLSAASLDVFNNNLWVHDLTLGKFISYSLDSILSPNISYNKEIIFSEKARQDNFPKWLNQNEIISTTFSDSKNRLVFTNNSGEVIRESFEMFAPPTKNIPYAIHNQSYHGVVQIKPDKKKVVVGNRYADLIEIYDLEGSSSKRIKTHSDYSPVYEVQVIDGYSRMAQDGTMRFGYLDIAVSDNYIYTIYSGRMRAEGKANFGDTIIVFDWEGNYIKSYLLDNRAIALEVIEETQLLTIESIKGRFTLKKYDL